MSDRTVHASLGPREIVRYDRQGRWYNEHDHKKVRIATVHDAATLALTLEDNGGEIYEGQPGGKQFDAKVTGARQKRARSGSR